MTIIAIKRRLGMLEPDLSELQAAANACADAWSVARPSIRMYWFRKPRGSWRIIWSNNLPSGAAGVHLDDKGVPYALIGSGEGLDVVGHEALEMLVDPVGTRFLQGPSLRTGRVAEYLVEVCDPVERDAFAFVHPAFYSAPHVDAGGYISWIEKGAWWQAFADEQGRVSYQELGPAQAKTRNEKDRLAGDAH